MSIGGSHPDMYILLPSEASSQKVYIQIQKKPIHTPWYLALAKEDKNARLYSYK
jgi:hypothetical protein